MNKNTEISERILQLIDYLGVNRNEFAKSLGYERAQGLYDMTNGKAKPSFDFFQRFANSEYSENININWLLTGNEEMIKKKEGPVPVIDDNYKELAEARREIIELLKAQIKELKKELEPPSGYRNVAEPDR